MRHSVFTFFFLFLAITLYALEGNTNSTGTIRFETSGGKGDYSVFLDGNPVGMNLTEIPAVKAGTHRVEVHQQRLDRENVLFLEDLDVPDGGEVIAAFKIPEELRSETRTITLMKRRVEQALDNNDSLFDLRNELDDLLLKMPDWMKEKPVLEDYALKVKIELKKREAVTDFIYGDPVDISFFQQKYNFLSYKGNTTAASEDFAVALEYILVLKRLEMIRSLEAGDYDLFAGQRSELEQYQSLTASLSADFEQKYAADLNLLNGFYGRFVENRRRADTKHLRRYMEVYYGKIWNTLSLVRKGEFILDSREVLALKADYLSMDTAPPWDPDSILTLEDPLRLFISAGGGSLLTVGLHWKPVSWFAFDAGISGAFDFFDRSSSDLPVSPDSPFLTLTVPIEADFFLIDKKLQLYLGITLDFLRFQDQPSVHWSNSWSKDGSCLAFWTSTGINLGIGVDLGAVDLYLNNYLQFPEFISPDFNVHSFRYSPAIGIRL